VHEIFQNWMICSIRVLMNLPDDPYIVHLNFIHKWVVETTHCHMIVIWLSHYSHVHCSTIVRWDYLRLLYISCISGVQPLMIT